jgi:hypothetical protein
MINFYIPAESSISINYLTGEEGVRRILCYSSGSSTSNLLYNGNVIGTFSSHNNINIDFESYYGFPRLSDLAIESVPNNSVSVLVDVAPYSDTTDNYIETRSVS